MESIIVGYKQTYAFLSHKYWSTQDEYNDDMSIFYDTIINHESIMSFHPKGFLHLDENEWTYPKTVDDTIDKLDEDEEDMTFVCNWRDDENTVFYTLLTKNEDEGDVRCITRTLPMTGLDIVPEKLIDAGWKPYRFKTSNSNQRIYIWESPELNAYDFIEMYKAWCTQYSSSDEDVWSEDETTSIEDSAHETSTTENDETPRFRWRTHFTR